MPGEFVTVQMGELIALNVSNLVIWIDEVIAFIEIAIGLDDEVVLALCLKNAIGVTVTQYPADKALELADEDLTHILGDPGFEQLGHEVAILGSGNREVHYIDCRWHIAEADIGLGGLQQFDELHVAAADGLEKLIDSQRMLYIDVVDDGERVKRDLVLFQ